MALALADDGHKFTDRFTIYTDGNPPLAAELESLVAGCGVRVDDRKIKQLRESKLGTGDGGDVHGDDGAAKEGILLDFADGTSQLEGFLVHRPLTRCESPLASQLGLAMTPAGDIQTSMPFCQTSVPGVFAAGDCASMMKIIPHAVAMGAYAGCGIARELPRRVTGNPCK